MLPKKKKVDYAALNSPFMRIPRMSVPAARALLENTELSAEEIVRKAMKIAADLCVFTNHNLTVETV